MHTMQPCKKPKARRIDTVNLYCMLPPVSNREPRQPKLKDSRLHKSLEVKGIPPLGNPCGLNGLKAVSPSPACLARVTRQTPCHQRPPRYAP
jgi:hypothetical protein